MAQIAAYRQFEATLAHLGSAPRYLGLLAIIGTAPGQPQSRLAEAVALKRSSLVAIIDRLEAEGLVERRHAPSDRRVNAVWLTQRGQQVFSELVTLAEREEARITAGLTADERAQLVGLLGRVIENLERSASV
ncbi:MAG: MarR family transcriptional regulator [Pseudomonadota bacterium]|nr:MarR family transcriptional regulator [Pseudomonadota bacterium]